MLGPRRRNQRTMGGAYHATHTPLHTHSEYYHLEFAKDVKDTTPGHRWGRGTCESHRHVTNKYDKESVRELQSRKNKPRDTQKPRKTVSAPGSVFLNLVLFGPVGNTGGFPSH